MVELKNKLELFHRMIWGEAKRESEKALYEATETTSQLIEKRKKEIEEKNQEAVDRKVRLAEEKSNREISLQKEERRRKILAAREACLKDLIADLEKRLEAYAKSEKYKEELRTGLEESLKKYDPVEISLADGDQSLAEEILARAGLKDKVQISRLDKDQIGGYIIYLKEGRSRIRFTLKSLLEEKSYEIGRELTESLERKQ